MSTNDVRRPHRHRSRDISSVPEHYMYGTYAYDTKDAFDAMPYNVHGWCEQALRWTDLLDRAADKPRIHLIRMKPGAFYTGETSSRTEVYLCVRGNGNVLLETLDTKHHEHVHQTVDFDSEFTDSVAVPPRSCFRFFADVWGAHLIRVRPRRSWPRWLVDPPYVNPGAFVHKDDFKRNYKGLSQMADRQPTPFYAPEPEQRARRHRIWGREGLDIEPGADMGRRDFAKPFTHLVLYTFLKNQKNFEHYHPHSWEFVYCIQGYGTMRLREFREEFDPKDPSTWPYTPACPERSVDSIEPLNLSLDTARRAPKLPPRLITQIQRFGFFAAQERIRRDLRRNNAAQLRAFSLECKLPRKDCGPPAGCYPVEQWGENWYSWARKATSFELRPGTAVLVPKGWLHEYEAVSSYESDELLLVYAMQTPQPIMHLLEHQANGWNPDANPVHGRR